MPAINPRTSMLGRRLARRSAGLEPNAAAAVRSFAAGLLSGKDPDPSLLGVGRISPVSLGIGLDKDWNLVLEEPYYEAGPGVAVMELCGPIYYSCGLWEVFLMGAMPTGLVVEAIDRATADPRVSKLVMKMDCPGGSVPGAYELAGAIDRFKAAKDQSGKPKLLYAVASEMMCSLAVWMGCAADHIATTPTAAVGSVGTIILLYDDSRMYAELGIEPHFIASTPRKMQGHGGQKLDDTLLDDERRIVEKHWGEFKSRVAANRGMSEAAVEALEARCYIGSDAVDAGLVDSVVQTFDEFLGRLVAGQIQDRPRGQAVPLPDPPVPASEPEDDPMKPDDIKALTAEELRAHNPALVGSIETAARAAHAEKPATIAELKAAFPGSENAEFRESCNEKALTITQAKAERGVSLADQLKAERAKTAAAEARVEELEALNGAGKGTNPAGAAPPKIGTIDPNASKEDVKAIAKTEWAQMSSADKAKHMNDEKVYAEKRWMEVKAARRGG